MLHLRPDEEWMTRVNTGTIYLKLSSHRFN
jgi:hypothetical protein